MFPSDRVNLCLMSPCRLPIDYASLIRYCKRSQSHKVTTRSSSRNQFIRTFTISTSFAIKGQEHIPPIRANLDQLPTFIALR